MNDDRRDHALEMLRALHTFPGPYEFRAVVRPDAASGGVAAVLAVTGPDSLLELSERRSSQGNYLSVRVKVTVASAEQVLEVYEVLRGIQGLVTAM